MRYLPLATAVFALASLSAGQSMPATTSAPATAPATAYAPAVDAHKAEIARIAEELVRQLGSDDYQTREAAQAAVAEAHRAFLETVASHAADKDPEVQKRAAAAMKAMAGEASCQHAALKLDDAQRAKLKRFREKSPGLFARVFSPEADERAEALKQLAMRDDPKALAEPVLVICLGDGSEKVQAAAATAAGNGDYKSDAIVDALVGVLIRSSGSYVHYSPFSRSAGDPRSQAMTALKEIRPKRAVPALLALAQDRYSWRGDRGDLYELVALAKEKRAIPELVKLLDDMGRDGMTTWGGGPNAVTTTTSDMMLMCLLRLTDQKPAKYGFVSPAQPFGDRDIYGFTSDQDRKTATAKFKAWWEKNRKAAPYKDLKPLTIPDLPGSRRQERVLPGGVPLPPALRAVLPAPS